MSLPPVSTRTTSPWAMTSMTATSETAMPTMGVSIDSSAILWEARVRLEFEGLQEEEEKQQVRYSLFE